MEIQFDKDSVGSQVKKDAQERKEQILCIKSEILEMNIQKMWHLLWFTSNQDVIENLKMRMDIVVMAF